MDIQHQLVHLNADSLISTAVFSEQKLTMKVFELAKVIDKTDLPSMFVPVIESIGDVDMPDIGNPDIENGLNLDDLQDFKLTEYISGLILDTLRAARNKDSHLQILVPSNLTKHLAKDISFMSRNEPCGARGCALDITLEDGDMCTRIGKCQVDPLTVTTFEVTVVLQKETPKWFPKLQMMLRNNETRTVIKPTYKLIKRKLYRKESRVIVQESS